MELLIEVIIVIIVIAFAVWLIRALMGRRGL